MGREGRLAVTNNDSTLTTKKIYNFTTLETTPCRSSPIYNVADGTLGSISKTAA